MRRQFVQRGGWWVIGQLLLMLAVAIFGITCRSGTENVFVFASGLAFLTISVVRGFFGLISLGRNLTPFPKPTRKTKLVQNGIYGSMRHPLYTAVICVALGWSLFQQSWPALSLTLVLAIWLDAKARREEDWLQQRFSDYADYAKRVEKFIPWIY